MNASILIPLVNLLTIEELRLVINQNIDTSANELPKSIIKAIRNRFEPTYSTNCLELRGINGNKLVVVKLIRDVTNLDLKTAKELVDKVDFKKKSVSFTISPDYDLDTIMNQFIECGAIIEKVCLTEIK